VSENSILELAASDELRKASLNAEMDVVAVAGEESMPLEATVDAGMLELDCWPLHPVANATAKQANPKAFDIYANTYCSRGERDGE
jgi:hypothetical protein